MKNPKKSVEFAERILLIPVFLILLAGLVKTVFFPEEINTYENRYACQIAELTPASYADGSFQDAMESALADQIHLSATAKEAYNTFSAVCAKPIIRAEGKTKDHYVRYDGYKILGENVLYDCYPLSREEQAFTEKSENLNAVFAAHPELDFYLYYIEKDTDIDFLSGEKPQLFQCLSGLIDLPDDHMLCFEIDSFDEFEKYFYKTDHHWNCRGSYRAYTELASALGAEPLIPTQERTFSARFCGSKSYGSGKVINEAFTAYDFDFPEMDVFVNGQPASDYGNINGCFQSGVDGLISYGDIYGADKGLVEFDTHSGKENILILGESYDNAIVKLIASHFGHTSCVDLRYYAHDTGENFNFSAFAAEHDISKVLLIGNADFYAMKEFMVENY